MTSALWLLCLTLPAASPAHAKKRVKVDPLALAQRLLLDRLPSRAAAVLAEVDPRAGEVDLREYYRLRGLSELELAQYSAAVESLKQAQASGETSPATWYALASAELSSGAPAAALATLRRAPAAVFDRPGAHRLRAYAYHQQGERHRAFQAADAGFARFPAELELERMRALLLLELGLSQEGLSAARRLFTRARVGPEDYLTLAGALISARDYDPALRLLEEGLLRYPTASELREQLARVYFDSHRPLAAAQVMDPLGVLDPGAAHLTADLYLRAGKYEEALRMNARVEDSRAKLRQRITILVAAERFHELAALAPRAVRLGLAEDERQLYALAYAYFVGGDSAQSEALLERVKDPQISAQALAIRSAVAACRADVWKCD